MAPTTQNALVAALLERHGQTLAEELYIDVAKGTPAPLFRLLVAALLASARIDAGIAAEAARALQEEGWGTPAKMAAATWEQRTKALNLAGYARYDERTSRTLGDAPGVPLSRLAAALGAATSPRTTTASGSSRRAPETDARCDGPPRAGSDHGADHER